MLGSRALANLRALAEAFFATEAGPPPADRIEWLCGDFADFLQQIGPARWTLRLCLLALAFLVPLAARSLSPLRSLSLGQRIAALERIEQSFAAFAVLGLKVMLCILYFEHPDAAAQVGHDSTCLLDGEP